jgi:hypothetical protein
MRSIQTTGAVLLISATLQVSPAFAEACSCVSLAVGIAVQEPFEQDNFARDEFAARLGAFRRLFGGLEAGLESGYVGLGRAFSPFCGETGTLPCEFQGTRLNSIDVMTALRWRLHVGAVQPYVATGMGVFAFKGGKYTEDALLREIRGGISAAVGIHLAETPRLGVEARWLAILDSTGHPSNRNTDILTLMIGLNLD